MLRTEGTQLRGLNQGPLASLSKDPWADLRNLLNPWGPVYALVWAKDPQLNEVSRGLPPNGFPERSSYMLEVEQVLEAKSRREPGLPTPPPLCVTTHVLIVCKPVHMLISFNCILPCT